MMPGHAAVATPSAFGTEMRQRFPGILAAAALFATSAVLSLAVAEAAPLAARFVALFLPVLAGFGLAFALPHGASTIVAGLLAAVSAVTSVELGVRHAVVAGGQMAVLRSIGDAPAHPDATRFAFPEARAMVELRGSTTEERTSARGDRIRRSWVVVPLVPPDWSPARPVPAWLACSAPDLLSDCWRDQPRLVREALRERADNAADYRAAAGVAVRRHGLAVAPNAPFLRPTRNIASHERSLRTLTWVAPLAGFAVWLLGLCAVVFLAVRRRRRPG